MGYYRKEVGTMPLGDGYYAEERVIAIFGAEGEEVSNGMWAENTGPYGTTEEHDPDQATSGELHSKLNRMLELDMGDQIAQVRVGRREAVHLFLEGFITPKQFKNAYKDLGHIILPKIHIPYSRIGGLWFIVDICVSENKRGIVLLDHKGQLLKIPHNHGTEEDILPDVDEAMDPFMNGMSCSPFMAAR